MRRSPRTLIAFRQALEALARKADAIAALGMALKLAPGHVAAARELQKLEG